jgi:hypothetical protein
LGDAVFEKRERTMCRKTGRSSTFVAPLDLAGSVRGEISVRRPLNLQRLQIMAVAQGAILMSVAGTRIEIPETRGI